MDTEKRLGKAEALLTLAYDFLSLHAEDGSGSALVTKRIKQFLNSDSLCGLVTLKISPYFGEEKIRTIKEVRRATGLGLKESKDLVEGGGVVLKGINLDYARYMASILKQYGVDTEIEEGLG